MRISFQDLLKAVKQGLISDTQADKLWVFWQEQNREVPSFRFAHILYYLGGMIAISAVSIYVTNAWESLKGFRLLILAFFLFIFGLSFTFYFLNKKLRLPAGIMATFSLALVPLLVYNIQFLLGINPDFEMSFTDFHSRIDWYWVNMELVTLVVGAIMLYFFRFPFLLFPVAIVLWYMSMDLWPLLFNMQEYSYGDRANFSVCFGLVILLFAVYLDFKYDENEDYAFWLYIAGALTFWGGLSAQSSDNEWSKFFYCIINIFMLFVSAFLNRRVFAVLGVIGILGYLGHLAFNVFANSLGFPIVLIAIGMIFIFTAVFFTRMEKKINQIMRPIIPNKILKKMRH